MVAVAAMAIVMLACFDPATSGMFPLAPSIT